MHQAAEVVATSNRVSVPMRWVSEYERWIRTNKNSRLRESGKGSAESASGRRLRIARGIVGLSLIALGVGTVVLVFVH